MASDYKVIEDNTSRIVAAIPEALRKGLESIGLVAEGYAKRLCPVDTGRLRNSITHVVQGDAVYIGTNVEYGPHVEMGTSKQRAQPFLKPAASKHGMEYSNIIKDAMKNA